MSERMSPEDFAWMSPYEQRGYLEERNSHLEGVANLQVEIATWARETFDNPDQDHRLTKLGNEFEELRRLTTTDRANQAGIADECADIMHLMFQIAEAWGFDLLEQTRRKFEINKVRIWEPQPDGTYQHVKGGER